MVRKFLYFITVLIVLAIAAVFALRLWGDELGTVAFVPDTAFERQAPLAGETYADMGMWLAHPRFTAATDPARWRPDGAPPAPSAPQRPAAVFFVHPTSYFERAHWNAPLDDAQTRGRAQTFVRGLASPFAAAGELWAPRYRQATFGAFLTDQPQARQAVDAAYADVALAFDQFVAGIGAETDIILVGHSQGARHVLELLRQRVLRTPLQPRIALVYAIGWPISLAHDLPSLGLPGCATAEQTRCIMSWSSYAEPAEPDRWLATYRDSPGFDGQRRGDSAILCTNPLSGRIDGTAEASANLGTLLPDEELSTGSLVTGAVPARCDARGLLLIGDPPELGPYVLPGNNYHVYDIPLFWRNVELDVARRLATL